VATVVGLTLFTSVKALATSDVTFAVELLDVVVPAGVVPVALAVLVKPPAVMSVAVEVKLAKQVTLGLLHG